MALSMTASKLVPRLLSGETWRASEKMRSSDASCKRLTGKRRKLARALRQYKATEKECATHDCASPWLTTRA